MKNKTIGKAALVLLIALTATYAQDVTTIDATSEEISENLNLEAVASVFGDSKNLEGFENTLNDPELQISNLDLNEDGYVDYLRVVEIAEDDTHLIVLQSVLGEDSYQDVATIEVEKDAKGKTTVQIVGDVYLYGHGYIIEPIYEHRPIVFSWFWRPYYRPYRSMYYWGYYPSHFHFWKPFHVHSYKKNIHVHVNVKHTFHYTSVRYSAKSVHLHAKVRRNDYGKKYPHRAHSVRVAKVKSTNGNKVDAVRKTKVNGTTYRTVVVKKAEGSTKRVASVNKANGTSKRVASVKKPDGSRTTVVTKRNSIGSRNTVAVKKSSDGSRKVKVNKKTSTKNKKSRSKRTK